MLETDPLLSVYMTRELGVKSGHVTEDTARWSGLILFRGVPYVANLSAYGRSDRKVPTGTVKLTLDPITAFTDRRVNNIVIDIFEHPHKAVHFASEVQPGSSQVENHRPVHWKFTEPLNEPGPLLVGHIDTIHHERQLMEHDKEELTMFWELSQTLNGAQ